MNKINYGGVCETLHFQKGPGLVEKKYGLSVSSCRHHCGSRRHQCLEGVGGIHKACTERARDHLYIGVMRIIEILGHEQSKDQVDRLAIGRIEIHGLG